MCTFTYMLTYWPLRPFIT